MSKKSKLSRGGVDKLINDVSYLQSEAEAMQYVIDDIPYEQAPPEGQSIAEMLLLIDHAQISYYRPVLEHAVKESRPTLLSQFDHFEDTFGDEEKEEDDIHKILRKLAKHRAGLLNEMNNLSLLDWETPVKEENKEISLFHFIKGMIRNERGILREITEQIKVYHQDKENRRNIERKKKQQFKQQNDKD